MKAPLRLRAVEAVRETTLKESVSPRSWYLIPFIERKYRVCSAVACMGTRHTNGGVATTRGERDSSGAARRVGCGRAIDERA